MDALTQFRIKTAALLIAAVAVFEYATSGFASISAHLQYYGLVLICLGVLVAIRVLWDKFFCKGVVCGNAQRFELSLIAEVLLHAVNLVLLASIVYALWLSQLVWYAYALPALLCLLPISSSFNYFANRKDFMELRPGVATYLKEDVVSEFQFVSYSFYRAKSSAFSISYSKHGSWFLRLISANGTEEIFDLKDMNLAGHKNAMQRYLKTSGATIKP